MTKDTGPFRFANSWPRIAWSSLAAVVVISVVLGFVILSRYQQNGPTLGTGAARFVAASASLRIRLRQMNLNRFCARQP
jgi:hypothetical protein